MAEHVYLSTACFHAGGDETLHRQCGSRYNGYTYVEKKPAECKYCPAMCICPCHDQDRQFLESEGT